MVDQDEKPLGADSALAQSSSTSQDSGQDRVEKPELGSSAGQDEEKPLGADSASSQAASLPQHAEPDLVEKLDPGNPVGQGEMPPGSENATSRSTSPSQSSEPDLGNLAGQRTGTTFYIESPAPYVPRPKALSSTVRSDADRNQAPPAEIPVPPPTQSHEVVPLASDQSLFVMDDSINFEAYLPTINGNKYICSIHGANDEELYTGTGCTITFVVDRHLSFIKIAIESTDRRALYTEDIVSGSYLYFPYFALTDSVELKFLGQRSMNRGQEVQVFELSLPLDMESLGVQNILVPDVREEIGALKAYLTTAKLNSSQLKVQVHIYSNPQLFVEDLLAVDEQMRAFDANYLLRWCHPDKPRFIIQHNEFIDPEDRMNPVVTFARRTVFYNTSEYLVFMCIGDLEEHEHAQKEVLPYNTTNTMWLMQMPGQPVDQNRIFLGLIEMPSDAQRLQPGEKLKVMDPDTEDPETALHATVTLPIPGIPLKYMTVFLPLRWNPDHREFTTGGIDFESCQILPLPTATQLHLTDPINASVEGVQVSTSVNFSDNAYRHRVAGLAQLHSLLRSMPQGPHWSHVCQLLLGNDIDAVQRFDVYSMIPSGAEPLQTLSIDAGLNVDQQKVLQNARNAPAGFVIVKGPPGTGKSHTARALLRPLIAAKIQVLICGASNPCADDNAAKVHEMICQMTDWQGQFVVRVHAVETETAIAQSPAMLARERPEHARPQLVSPRNDPDSDVHATLTSLDLAATIHKLYTSQHSRQLPFVPDARVTEKGHQLSIGHRILQLIGQAEIGATGGPVQPAAGSSDATSISRLQEMYAQYRADVQFTQEQMQEFHAAIRNVRQFVLQTATCICTTPALAIEAKVYSACVETVRAIVVDEAGRCTEQEVVAVFAQYPNAVLKGLVGDNQQLPPLVKTQGQDNVSFFQAQYSYSLLDRLIRVGVPYVMLRTQYRMAPDIARVISRFGYRSQLIDHASVLFENRPMSQAIRAWNKQQFNRERCLVYINFNPIDTPTGADRTTRSATYTQVSSSGSRVNYLFVAYGIELAKKQIDLHPEATVAILTGYSAQHRLYLYGKSQLERADAKYSQLIVTTFDAAQGDEYDVTIVDLLVTRSAGFLNSHARINVALSRARMAMYVMANKVAISGCESRGLAKIQSEMLSLGTEYKLKERIESQYFTSADFTLLTGLTSGPNTAVDVHDQGTDMDIESNAAENNTVWDSNAPW